MLLRATIADTGPAGPVWRAFIRQIVPIVSQILLKKPVMNNRPEKF
jgi:hypothetical protein